MSQTIRQEAVRIAGDPAVIRQKSKNHWEVASQSTKGKQYAVHVTDSGIKCECPYHQKRGAQCKHASAVELKIVGSMQGKEAEPVRIDKVEPHCNKCKRQHIIKDGKTPCKKRAPTQRYKCKKCGRRFSGELGFSGRHYPAMAILLVLVLHSTGVSPCNIILALRESMGLVPAPITIESLHTRCSMMLPISSREPRKGQDACLQYS